MSETPKQKSEMQEAFTDAYGSVQSGADTMKDLHVLAMSASGGDELAAATLLMLTASYLLNHATEGMPREYSDEKIVEFLGDGTPRDLQTYVDMASRVTIVSLMRAKRETAMSGGKTGNA